ncbi:hypothetical protein KRR40_41565 [Niabella defluvii]|nr:hypothetical protein KRR40_41565 [Niabella sp. I65]
MRAAILEKAFKASYNKSDAWFLEAHSNWNSVCNAGLIYGALAILDEEKDAAIAIIERSIKSNLLPLKAFAPNGNYPEGPGYWNYGTSFQVMLQQRCKQPLDPIKTCRRRPVLCNRLIICSSRRDHQVYIIITMIVAEP